MSKLILINATPEETRVALIENHALAEMHIERARDRGIVGNIYKGKVVRVLPGMQAAFVDIGLAKAGFLHVSDFYPGVDELPLVDAEHRSSARPARTSSQPCRHDCRIELEVAVDRRRSCPTLPHTPDPIEERLRRGDEILVQVAKEPLGSKGARITSHISLPGRYLVYLPTTNHLGVSRRIEDEEERQRLRDIVLALKPPGAGFIIRTVCVGLSRRRASGRHAVSDQALESHPEAERGRLGPVPAPLRHGSDPAQHSRPLHPRRRAASSSIAPSDHQRILEFVDSFAPGLKSRVELHETLPSRSSISTASSRPSAAHSSAASGSSPAATS